MISQYLEKLQDELFTKKIKISNEIVGLNNEYKETVEMIKLLKETDDPTFDVFTPREVHNFNRLKVEELEQNQISITKHVETKKQELSKIEEDILEINNVIKAKNSIVQNIKLLSKTIDCCYETESAKTKQIIDEILNNI